MVETLRKKKKKVVRTKRRGGALNLFKARASSDYFSVNNQKIPEELAANRFILNNLYGLNGKVLQLPYPGEIFYANTDRGIENAYVCVQSCISGLKQAGDFNILQQFISKGAAEEYVGDISEKRLLKECNLKIYNKHLSLSYINYILRSGMSPNSPIFEAYNKILKMNKNKEIDLNSSLRFVKVYDRIKKLIENMKINDITDISSGYASNNVVYGVPLIKYTPEMLEMGLCDINSVKRSQRVIPFLLKDIRNHIRDESLQSRLRDNTKKTINLDQEDTYNNRFGVLDLEDSNIIPYSNTYKDAAVLLKEGVAATKRAALGDTSPEDTTLKETSSDDGGKERTEGDDSDDGGEEITEVDDSDDGGEERIEGDDPDDGGEERTEEGEEKTSTTGETDSGTLDEEKRSIVERIIENYEKFQEDNKENEKLSRVSMKANEIVKLVFPDIEDLTGEKLTLYDDFVILDVKTNIKAVKEGGKNAVGNLYILKDGKFKKITSKTNRRLKAVRKDLDFHDPKPKDSEKIAINKNPRARDRYIRVCYKYNGEEFWLSVFSENDKERISVIDNEVDEDSGEYEESSGGGVYSRRIRKKTLRKRYNSKSGGGKLAQKLTKGAINLMRGIRTVAKKTKKKVYDNLFTGQITSSSLSWLRNWSSTRMIDIEMRRKNWNFRVGDTFLWFGNEYLYNKWQTTSRELKSLGLLNEKYQGTRKITFLDSNTLNRLPDELSYCTIIGFGTDILYTTSSPGSSRGEHESKNEKIKEYVEYGNTYKHNNLLNGSNTKTLIYDRISSRLIREDIATKMKNPDMNKDTSISSRYEWAHYQKDKDLYNEKGKNVDDLQKREKTPNKVCYYIIESKTKTHLPSKICKVYVDELQLWAQNYSRFSSLLRRIGRKIKYSMNLRNSFTTQEFVNYKFEEAKKNWTSELNSLDKDKYSKVQGEDAEQAGGGVSILDIVDSGEDLFDKAVDTLEGNTDNMRDSSKDGEYGPKEESKILDNFPFLRALPATLYSYMTDFIINECNNDSGDPRKILETLKDKLSKTNVVDENIFYRYPSHLENFEIYYHYYFSKRDVRNIFKTMGQSDENRGYRIIPRMFKDITRFQTEEHNKFDELHTSIIGNNDKYSINEERKIRDINTGGINNDRVYKFFPEVNDKHPPPGKEGLYKYLEDIVSNQMNIRNIKDINKYGIDINRWINRNNLYSNKFVETDRVTYISIPSLLNITPNSKSKTRIELYSLGYYVFLTASDYGADKSGNRNQSLFWHDRHISIEKYEESIKSFPNQVKDLSSEKLKEAEKYLHAPIIFIIENGRVYIPPIFYSISETSLIFMKKEVQKINDQWTLKQFIPSKDNSDTLDIREYCIKFIESLKSNIILYVKNVDMPSSAANLSKNRKSFGKFDNIAFNQYNSRKRVLPVSTTMINQASMVESMNSINKLKGEYIQEIDKKFEVKASTVDPLNRIFGGLQTMSDSALSFYDHEHLMNAIKLMNDIESETGTSTTSSFIQNMKEILGSKISMDAIKKIGTFTGGSLFFQDKGISKEDIDKSVDNINFFKYLYYKYSHDINIFNEWPVHKGSHTFIRWRKTQEQGSTLALEPNMIMRLNNKKCISMYNRVKNQKHPVVYDFLRKLKIEMEKNDAAKFEGKLDDTVNEAVSFAKDTLKARTRGALLDKEKHMTLDENIRYEGLDTGMPGGIGSFEDEMSGGRRKTIQKKKKMIGRKTRAKLKRTGKKLKRTNKKNKKRTGKKKFYNP